MHLFGRLASPLLTKARGVRKVQGSGVINKNRWDCAGSSSGGHRCGDKCKGLVRFDVCKTSSAVKRPTAEKGHKKKKEKKEKRKKNKERSPAAQLGAPLRVGYSLCSRGPAAVPVTGLKVRPGKRRPVHGIPGEQPALLQTWRHRCVEAGEGVHWQLLLRLTVC